MTDVQRRKRTNLGQVVALADILANGVVILMLLIVLSIKIQSDQAQEEINQNADITTILSRDMAKSIIFNDLPSSPPAVLHDYHSCVIAHDCNEQLFPIIEVYDDGLRLKNENVRMSIRELLQRPNPLDTYISGFRQVEKANLRMDIYGVGAYYLVMSILAENGIHHPRHWHFLRSPGKGEGKGGMSAEEFMAKYQDGHSLSFAEGEGEEDSSGDEQEEGQSPEQGGFPSSSFDDLTLIEGGSFSDLTSKGLLSGQGEKFSEDAEQSEGEGDIKSRMRDGKFSQIGIKLPNQPLSPAGNEQPEVDSINSRELMLFLALLYLHYGYELGGLQVSYLQNTMEAMLKRPRHIRRNSNFPYVIELNKQLDVILAEENNWPEYFSSESTDQIDRVGLVGSPLSFINLYTHRTMSDKPVKTEGVSLLLRPWPSAYLGERTEVTDSIVLVHPNHYEQAEQWGDGERWLPLAFLTPVKELLNINLGFVLVEIVDGEIFIPGEFNQIWTKSGPIRPARSDRNNQPVAERLFYIYFPLAVVLLLFSGWLFVRIWRRRYSTALR